MKFKPFLSPFYFTREERKNIAIVIWTIGLFCFIQIFINFHDRQPLTIDDLMIREKIGSPGDESKITESALPHKPSPKVVKLKEPESPMKEDISSPILDKFDPNTLDSVSFYKYGLSPFVVRNIVKYRHKGGRFNSSDDLKKIYGMHDDTYMTLKDLIDIKLKAAGSRPFLIVDVNKSNQQAFKALNGIGDVLSARIIKFRNRLGGFYDINQLREVYGLQDSTFQRLRPHLVITKGVKTINLNTVKEDSLSKHPYINRKLARVITNYRLQHGEINSVEDLKKIKILTNEKLEKILPYLEFKEE